MGLFNKNPKDANFAGGSRNIMEAVQRETDQHTLIYLDDREDFNTNSVITVAPNEQVIFIKNGELYGVLPGGRHEVKTGNYPVLSRIRNMLTGGITTFTCQVYHVNVSEQNVPWGTSSPIEVEDWFLGNGQIGVQTLVRGSAEFRVCFNILEDDNAAVKTLLKLMGDKTSYTTDDLSVLFQAQLSQKVASVVGKKLEERSMSRSINAISSQLEDFSAELTPSFENLFRDYGMDLRNFSFYNLEIDNDTDIRREFMQRRVAAANVANPQYNMAVQQELLKDVATNPGSGGLAGAGAGIGMGVTAGAAFASMGVTAFGGTQQAGQQPNPWGGSTQQPATSQQPAAPQQQASAQQPTASGQPDPVVSLTKLKQMLDAGLITQDVYDAKAAEILSRL